MQHIQHSWQPAIILESLTLVEPIIAHLSHKQVDVHHQKQTTTNNISYFAWGKKHSCQSQGGEIAQTEIPITL